jgi:hypothetical protein
MVSLQDSSPNIIALAGSRLLKTQNRRIGPEQFAPTPTPAVVLKKNVALVMLEVEVMPGTFSVNVAVPAVKGLCGAFSAIERFANE